MIGFSHQSLMNDILFYDDSIYIRNQDGKIVLYNNSNEILSTSRIPIGHDRYEIVDLIDSVLIIFSGKIVSLIDKLGGVRFTHELDPIKIGRCLTKPFLLDREHIVFGTKVKDRVQFVKYNFMSNERIAQTASWKVFGISTSNVINNTIACVLDNSMLIAFRAATCETMWNRFEAAKIQKGIFVYKDNVVYSVQGMLRYAWAKEVKNVMVPSVRFHNLEYLDKDILYATCQKGSALCAINLADQKLLWETPTKPIVDTCFVPIKSDNVITNCIIARTSESVVIINADTGAMIHSLKLPGMTQMRMTGNFLIVNQTTGTTILGEK